MKTKLLFTAALMAATVGTQAVPKHGEQHARAIARKPTVGKQRGGFG